MKKYQNRKEQRNVTETMNALLLPLLPYLTSDTAIIVKRALYLLGEIEVDPQESDQVKEGEKEMTWGDIYNEFCKKFPNADVEDYRPAVEVYIPQLAKGIPNAIIVWLKDGSKVIYIAKSEGETNGRNSI